MKIYLNLGKSTSMRMMNAVMYASLLDLGHELVSYDVADIVIGLRDLRVQDESKVWRDLRKYTGKKYILYQVEQYEHRRELVDSLYKFGLDEIWGFDIGNEKEIYTPFGYHPCLLFESVFSEDIDVGFFGWQRGRRNVWRKNVRNKWTGMNSFDPVVLERNITRARINLNIHYYSATQFTEWLRIAYFLANKQFFISERFYCPIDVPQFDTPETYDALVEYYLKHSEERKRKANKMSKIYKEHFDMRDILHARGF